MSRGAVRTAVEVTLRRQAAPGTVNGIADELQADEGAVRRVVYHLRDAGHARPDGYQGVGRNGALKAVRWAWVGGQQSSQAGSLERKQC